MCFGFGIMVYLVHHFCVLILIEEWSCCRKRRGQQPTGALAHTAKASGFNSVSEMLRVKASENSELNNVNNKASENSELNMVNNKASENSELNKVNNKASENSELNKVNNNASVLPTKEATVAKVC